MYEDCLHPLQSSYKNFFLWISTCQVWITFFKPAAKLTGSQVEHFSWKFATSDLFLPCSTLPTPLFGFTNGLFLLLTVKAIIEHEARNGIPPNRIILGGFSQVVFFCLGATCCELHLHYYIYKINIVNASIKGCLLPVLLLRVGPCPCIPPWPASTSWLVLWPSAAGFHFTGVSHRYSHSFTAEEKHPSPACSSFQHNADTFIWFLTYHTARRF